MTQSLASGFKLGFRTIIRRRGVIGSRVLQSIETAQNLQHLHGVFFLIGRHMDIAAAFDFGQQLFNKRHLYQAAFVVAFFMPRVGEENMNAV